MFRPCIDLHEDRVKQIVGVTLTPQLTGFGLQTNYVSEKPASWFAQLYKRDGLRGGHVIMLGAGNETAAREALAAYPSGLQIGGGINLDNARGWLDAGASHVIVTSWVFREGQIDFERLKKLVAAIGKEKLVLDLSCRKRWEGRHSSGVPNLGTAGNAVPPGDYFVVTDRWQKFTDVKLSGESLQTLAQYCAEFLIHAVDVEGLCRGIDRELVEKLAQRSPIPTTYAGGAKSLADLEEVQRIGRGKIDLTIGSALDIFGGNGVRYEDAVAFNRNSAKQE